MIPSIAQQIILAAKDRRSPGARERDTRIEQALELIRAHGRVTASQVAAHLDVSVQVSRDYLRAIEHRGLITRQRSGNATVFSLAQPASKRRKAA